jgi:hypothetical protein
MASWILANRSAVRAGVAVASMSVPQKSKVIARSAGRSCPRCPFDTAAPGSALLIVAET